MVKTIKATFDGKSFVPDEAVDLAAGTPVALVVGPPDVVAARAARTKRLVEALGGPISHDEGERRLKALYESKAADVRLQTERK